MGKMTRRGRYRIVGVAVALVVGAAAHLNSQRGPASGENVVPVYEGWEANPDGSFDMLFGYMNRNFEEHVEIPIGPNNTIEPGNPDQGQPAHFYPRRQRQVFRVRVPKDWGNKDLVWTLTFRNRVEKAYGSILPVWENEKSPPSPSIKLVGPATRTIAASEPLKLAVELPAGAPRKAAGRGEPRLQPELGPVIRNLTVVRLDPGVGLGVSWVLYRGAPDAVSFTPRRTPVVDGRAATEVKFAKPGTYVLRGYALDSDGGVSAVDVTVTVGG